MSLQRLHIGRVGFGCKSCWRISTITIFTSRIPWRSMGQILGWYRCRERISYGWILAAV
ncbi:MAG: hypothetical protein PUC54_06905 [Clostridiales bacterium]|nr:hypothetical protein [Clostridiales bacterium]